MILIIESSKNFELISDGRQKLIRVSPYNKNEALDGLRFYLNKNEIEKELSFSTSEYKVANKLKDLSWISELYIRIEWLKTAVQSLEK